MPLLTDTEQRDAAFAKLELMAAPTAEPAIDDVLDAILDAHKLASTWANNTAYVYGDVVMPTVRNGHRYMCIQAGTSEALLANEPEWPTGMQETITEGASDPLLMWQEAGPEFESIYDVRGAAHQAWTVKAGRVAHLYATRQSGGGYEQQQVLENCVKMANSFSSLDIG